MGENTATRHTAESTYFVIRFPVITLWTKMPTSISMFLDLDLAFRDYLTGRVLIGLHVGDSASVGRVTVVERSNGET